MLDRYLWGNVSRISPEAPVPVVDVVRSEDRPGGTANVALNLKAMGAQVAIAGVLGNDIEGMILKNLLIENGLKTQLFVTDPDRNTTTKTRILSNQQQMLRMDREQTDNISPEIHKKLLKLVINATEEVDVLIFEDYDKGVLTPDLIEELIFLCNKKNIPTVVDPKYNNFFSYADCTLFKPNLKELNDGLGIQVQNTDLEAIKSAVAELRNRMSHYNTLVTLGENGVMAIGQDEGFHIPAHFRKITDVSGAGDTVVALLGLALGAKLPLKTAASIANLGGGMVCEEVGVVPIDRNRLLRELA